ncbi:MAG TPA: acyltransferase [Chloroflexi bacterium]|nr:acyltransferase [Chloroflexota bacterium]
MSQKHLRLPYMPGLDGLRAVAVLAVMAYHANLPLSDGGFLGVEVFFVLSGYLITSLLLLDWLDDGRLNYGNFWLRRARRLLPALWLLLLLVPVMARLVAPDALFRLREDVPAALAYVTNWVYILRKISYFEQFGRPPLLRHLWSLAVEEQFYLTWPLIFTALMAAGGDFRRPKRLLKRFTLAAVVLALASAAWRAYLYVPYTDPSRPYYGTDTRAAAILFGAAFAALWRPHHVRENAALRARSRRWAEILGWGGLAGLLVIFARVNDYTPFLYYGGFLLVDAATLAVVFAVAHPDTTFGKLLGHPVPRWVGLRSYGIYIWHWPIFAVLRPGEDWQVPLAAAVVVQFALTFAVAEASYRWLEHPIRKQGFKAWWGSLRRRWAQRPSLAPLTVGVFLALLAANVQGLVQAKPAPLPEAAASAAPTAFPTPTAFPSPTTTPRPATAVAAALPTAAATAFPSPVATAFPTPHPGPSLTIIGDSVLQSAVTFKFWQAWGKQVVVDAKPGRKMSDLATLIPELAAKGQLAPVVVIHLGTNYPFAPETLDDAMKTLLAHSVTTVFFVNIRRPVRWEDFVNKRIEEGVARWPQAYLIDWHALALQHPEWFVEDHIHLRYYGTQAYVNFIMAQVGKVLGKPIPTATPAP